MGRRRTNVLGRLHNKLLLQNKVIEQHLTRPKAKERNKLTHSEAVYKTTSAKCPAYYLSNGIENPVRKSNLV